MTSAMNGPMNSSGPSSGRPDPGDHRELNRDLELYAGDPLAGAGLPLWLPRGTAVREELERLAHDLARADGCVEVRTPVLGKRALFERSGHWAKFADDMFPPMQVGGDELVLRPANCPHHALVYRATRHSWRELPIRLHELGLMFRSERSGVLSGLQRVRQIALDDTHVFCRMDQVAVEAAAGLRAALRAQEVLGLGIDHVRLSLRGDGPGYLGAPEVWSEAEAALRAAGAEVGVELVDGPGEAAFYGPKLDLQVDDDTIATVQVDFVQPERFGLTYDAADGSRPHVVMIHRGTVGSMERVTAAVVERYAGRLPLWLAPVQVGVLPVAPDHDAAARSFADRARAAGLRVHVDHDGSLGSRIRLARQRRDAVIAVLGDEEVAAGEVQVTDVAADHRGRHPVEDVLSRLVAAHRVRRPIDWGLSDDRR